MINYLIENTEGLRSINSTVNGIKNYWMQLQDQPYFIEELQR
jgi:hypothetical protein